MKCATREPVFLVRRISGVVSTLPTIVTCVSYMLSLHCVHPLPAESDSTDSLDPGGAARHAQPGVLWTNAMPVENALIIG